ncbi:MAG: peptidoglycan bridge formation glycyltransferase FemA/FemB family protein [Rikenellaceae bacterium]
MPKFNEFRTEIMELSIEKKSIIDVYDTPIIQQTSFWSHVKQKQGLQSFAFDYKARNSDLYLSVGGYSYTRADFLLFLEYVNSNDCIAYVPYGPEVEPSEENQGIFLEELSESLRSYLPKDCIAIRYDLNWRSHWGKESDYSEDGTWLGAPEKKYQEFKLNFDTRNGNLLKSNSDILPANTIIIDLNASEQEIMSRMKPKTRYNIGLAKRKGVEVRIGTIDDLQIWYDLYVATAQRNGLHINDIKYFHSVFAAKMEKQNLPVHVKLLIASVDNVPLSAMFLLISSHRATYLYGASSGMRNFMPTYAMQWEAIQIAKAYGCSEYDMFGVAPDAEPSHPMYGLYKFKKGFGGSVFHQMGCWDYPLKNESFHLLQASEMSRQGYYL